MSAGRRLPNGSQISDGLNRNRSEAETTVTSLARRRLPHRLWQPIHLAAFPLLATATIHPLTAGSDRTNPAVVTMLVITSGVVSPGPVPPTASTSAQPARPTPPETCSDRAERLGTRREREPAA